jgi:hypothetical protein
MSQIRKGIFASLAIALTLGAAQFASGHDLMGGKIRTAAAPETGVNRAAKADRATVPVLPGQSDTIALRFDSLADTSVLVRVPVAKDASKEASNEARNEMRNSPPPPVVTKPAAKKTPVACEPPVSVLTDVAKLLQPGRCVT